MNKKNAYFSSRATGLLAGVLLGSVGGWLYWRQIGCVNGCLITGNWFVAVPYGGVMGGLLASLIISFFTNTAPDDKKE